MLDGYTRFVMHYHVREAMGEPQSEIILQRAKEKCTKARPRLISDNRPQPITRAFQKFIRIAATTHVRTSLSYLQPNRKIAR